jgi:hypothetical protein
MRTGFGFALGTIVALLVAPVAQAAVQVAFPSPESYTDASLDRQNDSRAREATLRLIREHLERLGQRHLGRDVTLVVEVLDVDLAGEHEPLRARAYNVRVMRDTTWPRIKLRYVLSRGERVLGQGEETVIDQNYLMHPDAKISSDPLRYEKRMLDNWFLDRIASVAQK